MSDTETILAAELEASRRRAEELTALLDQERKRALEAEQRLREREKLLAEKDRPKVDPQVAQALRQRLAKDIVALKQHSQRFSNAAKAVDVVIPGLKANGAGQHSRISAHFQQLRARLQEREDRLKALVDGLVAEKLKGLEGQKSRMHAIVGDCEAAIGATEQTLSEDDWTLLTARNALSAQIERALLSNCSMEAEWSEIVQTRLPPVLEEVIESFGSVGLVPIDSPESPWHQDLAVVSRIAEPPRLLQTSRHSEGNSDFGFMFDVVAQSHSICIRSLHIGSGTGRGPLKYTVYTAAGSFRPIRSSKGKWTQVGTVEAQLPCGPGEYEPVLVKEDGVHIAAGARQAFYIHSPGHMTAVAFTLNPRGPDGSGIRDGATVDEDGPLQVLTGAKSCSARPFESVTADAVRSFAGRIEYVLWCDT